MVFTIDDTIRTYFLNDRKQLNILFFAAKNTIEFMFNRLNVTPGFILVLHTFGRDLKWNPHIHCILTAGGYSTKTKEWKNINHFNFKLLRKSFMYILLKSLDVDKKVYLNCYKDHKNGFYVYAKENNINTKVISSYISRYLGRPCKHLQE